jgi:hypothetical protein
MWNNADPSQAQKFHLVFSIVSSFTGTIHTSSSFCSICYINRTETEEFMIESGREYDNSKNQYDKPCLDATRRARKCSPSLYTV